MKKKEIICFFLIIFLAAFLRLYKITLNPPHLYWDEASIAYNAYSINLTGKDEWGEQLPILFKAFGEYKFPVYIYATALFQKLVGFNDLAIRLSSALAGILTVVMIYFLTKQFKLSSKIALTAMLFLAISPWHLQFSRAGFEANVAVLFLTTGLYLFLRRNILLSLLFFAVSVYTYQGVLITVPLILAVLFFLFRQKIVFPLFFLIILLLPFIFSYFFSPDTQTRARGENFFHMPGSPVANFISNYTANFSLDYLFFHGDQDGRHSVKKIGELYLWQLPLVLAGIYILFRHRSKHSFVIFSVILIGSLPPALTVVSPHALRGLLAVVGWQIVSATGMVYLSHYFPKKLFFLATPILIYGLIIYLHLYYIHSPVAYAADWQDGQKQTVNFLKTIEKNYDKIYVYKDLQPIYLRLYWPILPGTLLMSKFIYFDFKNIPVKTNLAEKDLVVLPPWANGGSWNLLQQIKNATGDTVFSVYDF